MKLRELHDLLGHVKIVRLTIQYDESAYIKSQQPIGWLLLAYGDCTVIDIDSDYNITVCSNYCHSKGGE